jgi:hypothetical protein
MAGAATAASSGCVSLIRRRAILPLAIRSSGWPCRMTCLGVPAEVRSVAGSSISPCCDLSTSPNMVSRVIVRSDP